MPIPVAALAMAGAEAGAAGGAAAGGSSALLAQATAQFSGMGVTLRSITGHARSATLGFNPFMEVLRGLTHPLESVTIAFHRLAPVVLETVGLLSPITVLQFNRALMDLKAVFGSVFRPILQEVTGIVRRLADYLYSLPPAFKSVLASLARTTAIAGLVATLGTLFVGLGSAMAVVKAIFGPVIYLFEQFKNSIGGAGALSTVIGIVEGVFAGIVGAIQEAWNATAGIRSELSAAFNELGGVMSDFYEAFKPILGLQIALWASLLTGALIIWGGALKVVTKLTTLFYAGLTALISPLSKLLGILGLGLPDMNRETKSSFGMGFGGTSVTDPASLYNKLTEEIGRSSRAGAEDPQETISKNTDRTAVALETIVGFVQSLNDMLKLFVDAGVAAAFPELASALRAMIAALKRFLP